MLVHRIKNRIAQTRARGEALRVDDSPEVLQERLAAYRAQTAPLTAYYSGKDQLKMVDGMASIDDVTIAIGRALAETAFRPAPANRAGRGGGKSTTRPKPASPKKGAKKGNRDNPASRKARSARARPSGRKSGGKARARRLTK